MKNNNNDFWNGIMSKVSKALHSSKSKGENTRLSNFITMLKEYYICDTYDEEER